MRGGGVCAMYILQIQPEGDMVETYTRRVMDHSTDLSRDAGFELACRPAWVETSETLSTGVRCAAYRVENNVYTPSSFYVHRTTSLAQTPLRMTSHTLHVFHRGTVRVKVNNLSDSAVKVGHKRLFQICMPDLKPFRVELVTTLGGYNPGGAS